MMKNALTSMGEAARSLRKDKVNILLTIIPILIGIIVYYFAGSYVYETVMGEGQKLIENYVSEGTFGSIVYYLVATIITILLYFLVSFTFVLFISLIASPFNDLLSARVEKIYLGEKNISFSDSLSFISGKISAVVFNEVKKILFIIILSGFAFLFSYIPFLTPIGIFVNVLLLAIGFVDYTWARKNLSFSACVGDIRRNLIGYGIGGAFFFLIVSVPVVNLIVPPLATSYFTIFWMKNNESRR